MKVSIIIPIYNVASYVEACLQSVFNQTYQNIEILLVDDCGTDDSMDIVTNLIKAMTEILRLKFYIIRKTKDCPLPVIQE